MGSTGVRTILYPVRDLARAKELFTRLAGRGRWGRHGSVRPCHGYGRSTVQSVGPSSGSEISSITSKPNRW